MKRTAILLGLVILGVGWLDLPVMSQRIDLVKLRKKEAERRKKLAQEKKKETRVRVDNGNLKKIVVKSRPLGYIKSETEKDAADSGEQTDVKPLELDGGSDENAEISLDGEKHDAQYWQQLKRGLEENIAELSNLIRLDQLRLNQLHTQYLTQDLPLQKQQIKEELDGLQKKHEADKERLKALNRELEELYEKARRAGVPPGWLR